MRHQGFNDRINIPFEHRREIIERQLDSMIGDPILRKVVSADSFVAFPGADLRLALRRGLRVLLFDFPVEQPRTQDGQRSRLVLLL